MVNWVNTKRPDNATHTVTVRQDGHVEDDYWQVWLDIGGMADEEEDALLIGEGCSREEAIAAAEWEMTEHLKTLARLRREAVIAAAESELSDSQERVAENQARLARLRGEATP